MCNNRCCRNTTVYVGPKRRPANHGKFWTELEDGRLLRLRRQGFTIDYLRRKFRRSHMSILDRLYLLKGC